ncbi:MAG: glutaredoxin family protein [Candidatus Limnocylindrales bacterium]
MSPSTAMPMPTIAFYTRAGCHLCQESRVRLQAILEERAAAGRTPCRIEERALTEDPAWERRYMDQIPVIVVDDQELPLALSARAIREFLARTLDAHLA